MSPELLNRPVGSELLSDDEWKPREPQRPRRQLSVTTDVTSGYRSTRIGFGAATLVLAEPPPPWMDDLLAHVGQLGDLEADWDSYGARPIDPEVARATVRFLMDFLRRDTPQPAVVPTNRGGIQLEWHRAGVDLEIQIESPARFRVFFEDQRTGDETETTLLGNLEPLVAMLDRLSSND